MTKTKPHKFVHVPFFLLLFILLSIPFPPGSAQADEPNKSANDSNVLNRDELRLFRIAFNDSKIEQLLEYVSENKNVLRERLRISTASMFVYRYLGQKTTQHSSSMIESPFWVVEVQDIKFNRAYEVYVQDGTSIYKGRIMTDEQSQELALHFKKYGKMESDLYNALASMKGEDKINVIIWPVVVYPANFIEENRKTVEDFIKSKGYDFIVLEPFVIGADLPEDIIGELEQRKDIENLKAGQKIGNNTRVIIRIKPDGTDAIIDEQIKPIEEFIISRTSDFTTMKPVFFAQGLTKNTVLELNNRTDVLNIAMEHTFRSEAAQEESVRKEEKTPVVVKSEQIKNKMPVPTLTAQATPGAPGSSAILAVISLLIVTMCRRKI